MYPLLALLVLCPFQGATFGTASPRLLDVVWEAGGQPGGHFGAALAAGDVDGDGYEDLVVGSPGAGGSGSPAGSVELYRGSATGLEATPSWTHAGSRLGERFGFALATADVNGDGFADLLVAAPDFDVPSPPRHLPAALGHNPGPGGPTEPALRDVARCRSSSATPSPSPSCSV
jgi:hypothetical protein